MILPGLYRGLVVDNNDSNLDQPNLGRVQVRVPQIHGTGVTDEKLPWAWPCIPFAGWSETNGAHGAFVLPSIGDPVWIAFEQGDPNAPIWLGGWYGQQGGQTEVDDELLTDSASGETYPDISQIRFPQGQFIRAVGDDRLEIGVDADHRIVLDSRNSRIDLAAGDWDIRLQTSTGNISVQGNVVTLLAGSHYIALGSGTRLMIVAGTLDEHGVVNAAGTVRIFGASLAEVLSATKIQGAAPHASGFENH